jgi:hypothetical protein
MFKGGKWWMRNHTNQTDTVRLFRSWDAIFFSLERCIRFGAIHRITQSHTNTTPRTKVVVEPPVLGSSDCSTTIGVEVGLVMYVCWCRTVAWWSVVVYMCRSTHRHTHGGMGMCVVPPKSAPTHNTHPTIKWM